MSEKYCANWEEIPEFKSWLTVDSDGVSAFCKICNRRQIPHRSRLLLHLKTEKHQSNVRRFELSNCNAKENSLAKHDESIPSDEFKNTDSKSIEVKMEVSNEVPCEKKPQIKKREFVDNWTNLEEFKDWIVRDDKNLKTVSCAVCKSESIKAQRSVLIKHKNSYAHIVNYGLLDNSATIIAELKIAGFFVENNESFNCSETMIPFLQQLVPDSKIIKTVSMDRKKIREIIVNVIAPAQQDRLMKYLKNQSFSILIDEATDVSVHHTMCIVVRYYDYNKGEVSEELWDLVEIYDEDEYTSANAEKIFQCIKTSFESKDVPLDNIIAFCSDNCNLMQGNINSVATKLKDLLPNILLVKCSCHIEHLCTQYAMKHLPCTEFVSILYNYMSGSAKRKHMWNICQKKLYLTPLMILKPIFTRWLSYYDTILRILRRRQALIVFFENVSYENTGQSQNANNDKSVEQILEYLKDTLMHCYLTFLETILGELAKTNKVLQNVKPLIPECEDVMRQLYISILKMYIKEDHIVSIPLENVDPTNWQYFKKLDDINVGEMTQTILSECNDVDDDSKKEFRLNCQKFLIEICVQFKKRFDLNDKTLILSSCFHPKNTVSSTFHKNNENLNAVMAHFKFKDHEAENVCRQINTEWELLPKHEFSDDVDNMDVQTFWNMVSKVQNNDQPVFKNVSTLAFNVLCIPNSNASPERVWSKYALEKTHLRNKLNFESIRGILLSSQYIKYEGGCIRFNPKRELIDKMIEFKKKRKNINKIDKTGNENDCMDDNKYAPNHGYEWNVDYNAEYIELPQYGSSEISFEVLKLCSLADKQYSKRYSHTIRDLTRPHNDDDDDNDCNPRKKLKMDLSSANVPEKQLSESYEISLNEKLERIEIENDYCYNINNNDKVTINTHRTEKIVKTSNEKPVNYQVSTENVYLMCKNFNFTVGIYKGKKDHPIRDQRTVDDENHKIRMYGPQWKTCLFSNQYITSFDNAWIDGDVIDAWAEMQRDKWDNCVAVPTQLSVIMLVNMRNSIPTSNWPLYHIKEEIQETILIPYLMHGHWCLFVIHPNERIAYHLDPYEIEMHEFSERSKLIFANFREYQNVSAKVKKNNINTTTFKHGKNQSVRPLQSKVDGVNCGAYVMYYMDVIGRRSNYATSLDPVAYRYFIAKELLHNSKSLNETCLFCFRRKENDVKIKCTICNRFSHESCLRSQNINAGNICKICSTTTADGNIKAKKGPY